MAVGAGAELGGAVVGALAGGASEGLVTGAGAGAWVAGAPAWLAPAVVAAGAAARVLSLARGCTLARVDATVGEAGPAGTVDDVAGAGRTFAAGAGAARAKTIAKPTVASAPS